MTRVDALPITDPGLRTLPEDTLTPADLDIDVTIAQPAPDWLAHRACDTTTLHADLTADAAEYARTHSGWWVPGVDRDGPHTWWVPTVRDGRRYDDDVRAAKAVCLACPVMVVCRAVAVRVAPVAGVAGAWTETQRDTYRAHHGIPAPVDRLDDNDPADLTPTVLARIDVLTRAGWSARQIAADLDSPEITATTVEYVWQLRAGTKARRSGRAA